MFDRLPKPITLVEHLHQLAYLCWEVPLTVAPNSHFLLSKSLRALSLAYKEREDFTGQKEARKAYFSD